MVELTQMKIFARSLPFVFFTLLFGLIAIIITGFWIRNEKITQIPKQIIEQTVGIFTKTKEVENIIPDSGYITDSDTVTAEFKNLDNDTVTLLIGSNGIPITITAASQVAKTDLKLEPGVNIFKLITLSSNDFTPVRESTFVYFRNEEPITDDSIAIYGKITSILGGTVEVKSLISGRKYTLSTSSQTAFLFVNPREENDGNQDQSIKDIDKLEIDDIVVGVGSLQNIVQTTQKLISYSSKEPSISFSSNLKSGTVSSVDIKKEFLTISGDKTRYYWDKSSQSNTPFVDLKKDQRILFYATPNSYGNLIIKNILNP